MASSAIRDLLAVAERPDVISLAGGLPAPEAFPLDELRAAAASILDEQPEAALQYSATEGYEPLRAWVSARMGGRATVVTHGAQQALDLIARATLDPGDVVALADPAYVGALQVFRLAGARLAAVPTDEHGMDVGALARMLGSGERPRLVYVVPNFDNPSGSTMTLSRRQDLAALADRYGFLVVEDDPYGALRFHGRAVDPIRSMSASVVSVGTFSKTVSPGLRVGYLAGPAPLVADIVRMKQALDLHTGSLVQRMVHRVVSDPSFEAGLTSRLAKVYAPRAEALVSALGDAFAFRRPDGGMFVWAQARREVDTEALLPRAIERGVAYVPGSAFSVASPHRRALRLSFATAAPADLAEAVRRLRMVL